MIRAVCVGDQEGTPFLRHCNGISALFLFYHTPINELAILPLRQLLPTMTPVIFCLQRDSIVNTAVFQQLYCDILRALLFISIVFPNLYCLATDSLLVRCWGNLIRVYFGTVLTLYVQVSVFFSWEGNATRNGSVV